MYFHKLNLLIEPEHKSTDQWNKIWSLERDPQNTQALIKLAFQISDEIYSVNGVGITWEPSGKKSWIYNSYFHKTELYVDLILTLKSKVTKELNREEKFYNLEWRRFF